MLPSNRPPSPQSIHSWWSDSNSLGPTISIHAAAKPLMRLLYHRQVQNFIKRNLDLLLSEEVMEIYISYLAVYGIYEKNRYKYISPATKSLILRDLHFRVILEKDSEGGVIQRHIRQQWPLVTDFLCSDDTRIRRHMWNILRDLAVISDDSESASWASWICPRMIPFLSDTDSIVQNSALNVIKRMSGRGTSTRNSVEILASMAVKFEADNGHGTEERNRDTFIEHLWMTLADSVWVVDGKRERAQPDGLSGAMGNSSADPPLALNIFSTYKSM
ncbi:hypothetical protein R3P38DRAFT_3347715 [Favolaschia claudopus]|uniref:Uncharacterized protein n=1 Tax=Favolaschia claudopus TaxID=2862362 RepID=A0AAW0CXB8_9AGAR